MIKFNLQLFALNKKDKEKITPTNAVLDTSKPAAQPTQLAQNTNVANGAKMNGVDQATLDKMNSSFTASTNTTNAQNEANSYLQNVKDLANTKDIISQNTWDAINKQFSASSAYNDAMNYTNGLLQQLSSGKTSYSDKVDAMISQIQNREAFSYDVDKDTLFQQALASAMNSGQTAMQNTIGQASALTGGYGSSYATSAANQQYNAYIQDAYNNLPEYYQMALEAYQMEGEDMYNQLAMLSDADAKEYERLYNSWNANFSNAQNMYNNEYNAWRDSVNNAFNSAGLQLQEHGQLFDQAYNTYNAVANNAQQMYQNEYNKWADEVNNAFKNASMLNQDYWNTTNFNEDVRQYEKNFAEDVRQFDQTFAENVRQFDTSFNEDVRQFDETLAFNKTQHADDMAYKNNALAQSQAQHEAEMAYKNSALAQSQAQHDAEMAYKDKALQQDDTQFYASLNAKSNESGNPNDSGLKEPTETQKSKALDAYNTGGMSALNQYINSVQSNVDKDMIAEYVGEYGQLPLEQRTFTKTKDTTNWFWGVDNNDKVVDEYGNEYRIDELPESLQKDLTKLKKNQSYTMK